MTVSSTQANRLRTVALALIVISCSSSDHGIVDPPPVPVATSLTAVSSTSISATVGAAVTPEPAVVVKDQLGQPMAGVSVTFAIASGGGSITGGTATTNSSGIATVGSWTLGPNAGANTLTASSGSLTPVTFTATGTVAGAPASLTKTAGDGQTATVSTAVATAPAVIVKDASGTPLSGVTVTFAVASGGGSVTGATQTTNASGIATVGSWTLGTTAGTNTLTASSGSLTPVTFIATGVAAGPGPPALLTKTAGDGQTATVSTAVAVAPAVTVTDASGNPLSGVTVTFAVASGGGSVTGATQTTNAAGVATVGSWTLGPTPGSNTLTASSGSLTPVTFTATGAPPPASPPASMVKSAGDGQSATVSTAVAVAPAVLVTDVSGLPVSGVIVTFTVASGGGSVTAASQATNASGIATVGSWILGSTPGANTLTASSGSLIPVTFTATGVTAAPGPPASLTKTAGDGQTATVGTAVLIAPSVTVADANGNPLSGITVTFAVASGGGSVTGATQTTNASGIATVGSWTLGANPGSNTLTASSGSLTPVTFSATGAPPPAAPPASIEKTAGDGQTATAGTAVATAPAVIVKDASGNPLSGVVVSFAVASGGGSVTGANPITNASGIAAIGSWTLGAAAGNNTLSASAGSLTPVIFTATGIAGPPALLVKTAGDGQSATYGTAVAVPPSVKVTDASGNPLSGLNVAFAVASGGGSITGGAQVTNASGIATVGSWTVGSNLGPNTLTASSGSLTSVTFTATSVAGPPTSMVISAGDGQSAVVTTPLPVSPAVTLTDVVGHPVSGATVLFAVASGGGSLTGATQTTNASGIATVGSWSLGSSPGSNTLTASSGSLAPVTFTATALLGPPASLVKTAGDGQSGTVSTAVVVPPAVRVTDIGGNPLSGETVVFAVASGGGSVTGGTQTTDASGIATVGSWILGPDLGSNKLTASSGSLPPVTFNATGHAPPTLNPTNMVAFAGDNQSATASAPVSVPPAVLVTDASGTPVGGVPVSFDLASGGGTVSGASVITDASGIAAIGAWILGPDPGTNTLTAKSPSLPTVTFTATGTALVGNPCTTSIPHLIQTVTNAVLTTSDCQLGTGRYVDFFSTSTPSADAYLFTQTSNTIDSYLFLLASDGTLIADVDDATLGSPNSAMKVILPSGSYLLAASAYNPGEVGYYALESSITSTDVTNCEDVYVARGISTTQNIQNTDCDIDTYTDGYLIYLTAGQQVTISMSSSEVDSYLELYKPGVLVASNDNASGANAQIVYTPTTTGYYIIYARTAAAGQTGSYTLAIQ